MKRRLVVPEVMLIAVLLAALVLCQTSTLIAVYAIGTPDAYGNVIMWFSIEQWNGSSYVVLKNVTSDTPWSQRVVDDEPIRFQMSWRLNNTLASSTSQAVSYTRVYMNITSGIWTLKELNNTSSRSDASYYYGVEVGVWNATGYPAAGVSYNVTTQYEAYY